MSPWAALVCVAVLAAGCATPDARRGPGITLGYSLPSALPDGVRAPETMPRETARAQVHRTGMAGREVASRTVQVDAFEQLLMAAGLNETDAWPVHGASLTAGSAARLRTVLLKKPVTLSQFPPRQAVGHLLREALESGEVSREELLRRVERFSRLAALRPDGYLAWVRTGRTQQRVAPVEWKDGALRSGLFELGRFYAADGGVFRPVDAQLRPVPTVLLAEVYDDADYLNRTLDGAQEAFIGLYHAMGQLLSRPWDHVVALQHLPAGVAALVASSPEYLERFRHMTRGEQVQALAKLTTSVIVTWGAAAGTVRTVAGTLGSAEATVPVLSLSAEGLLVLERATVQTGAIAATLGTGAGGVYVLATAAKPDGPAPAASSDDWVTFAHGTSVDFARDISAHGLDASKSLAAQTGSHSPGSFFTHLIGPPGNPGPGLNEAAAWATPRFGRNSAVLIGRMPKRLYLELEKAGLVRTQPVPGAPPGVPYETIFSPLAYEKMNASVIWQLLPLY